jgi:hypothetical protein
MHPPKIQFIHNALTTYRAPFFKLLDEKFDIRFIFTAPEARDMIYGESYQRISSELRLSDAKFCKSYLSNALPSFSEGVPLGLIKYLFAGDSAVV